METNLVNCYFCSKSIEQNESRISNRYGLQSAHMPFNVESHIKCHTDAITDPFVEKKVEPIIQKEILLDEPKINCCGRFMQLVRKILGLKVFNEKLD